MGHKGKLPTDLIKYAPTGTIDATLPANTGFIRVSEAHNLGYIPAVLGYITVGGGIYVPLPYLQFDSSSGVNLEHTRIEADDTNVSLLLYAPNVGGNPLYSIGYSRSVRYYLLQQPQS